MMPSSIVTNIASPAAAPVAGAPGANPSAAAWTDALGRATNGPDAAVTPAAPSSAAVPPTPSAPPSPTAVSDAGGVVKNAPARQAASERNSNTAAPVKISLPLPVPKHVLQSIVPPQAAAAPAPRKRNDPAAPVTLALAPAVPASPDSKLDVKAADKPATDAAAHAASPASGGLAAVPDETPTSLVLPVAGAQPIAAPQAAPAASIAIGGASSPDASGAAGKAGGMAAGQGAIPAAGMLAGALEAAAPSPVADPVAKMAAVTSSSSPRAVLPAATDAHASASQPALVASAALLKTADNKTVPVAPSVPQPAAAVSLHTTVAPSAGIGAALPVNGASTAGAAVVSAPLSAQSPLAAARGDAVAATPSGLAASISAMHQSGQMSALLRLDPPGLGALSVHIGVGHGAQVNVQFIPTMPHAAQLLTHGMDDLRQAMSAAGLTLGQAQVGGGSPGTGGGGNDQRRQPSAVSDQAAASRTADDSGVRAYA